MFGHYAICFFYLVLPFIFECLAVCSTCIAKKNLVRPGGQGKSQSQGFIDELSALCWHDAVQIENLACWYPFFFTDRVPCWSFLLLSVLQIVDSRPSWTVVSVLGELCSTTWIAVSNMMWELPILYTCHPFYWLFLVCCF